jgi:hypothetical protein
MSLRRTFSSMLSANIDLSLLFRGEDHARTPAQILLRYRSQHLSSQFLKRQSSLVSVLPIKKARHCPQLKYSSKPKVPWKASRLKKSSEVATEAQEKFRFSLAIPTKRLRCSRGSIDLPSKRMRSIEDEEPRSIDDLLRVSSSACPHDAVDARIPSRPRRSEPHIQVLPEEDMTEEMRRLQEASPGEQHWVLTDRVILEAQARNEQGAERRQEYDNVYIKSEPRERHLDDFHDSAYNTPVHSSSTPKSSPPLAPKRFRKEHGIDVFFLCTPHERTLIPYETRLLVRLQKQVDAVMAGKGIWLKILFRIPHSIKLLPMQKQKIYAAQALLNLRFHGRKGDPVIRSQDEALAMAMSELNSKAERPPVQQPVNVPRPRPNAFASFTAITAITAPHEVRAPPIGHCKPQQERISKRTQHFNQSEYVGYHT